MIKKTNLRIVERIYGNKKREVVFQEVYEQYFGVKVTVTRKKLNKSIVDKQAN
ncbi:hypothetical protein BN2127_JRS10_02680 [Bacillus subtilis]|nr:hypothetical protein BN2127_JRS10_02680 [Bacillus subtilis]